MISEALYKRMASSKNPVDRQAAIDEVVAMGSAAIPDLQARATKRGCGRSDPSVAIEAIGRIGGSEAVEALLEIEAAQRKKHRNMMWAIGIYFGVMALILLVSIIGHEKGFSSFGGSFGGFAGVFGVAGAAAASRGRAVDALSGLRDPKAAGTLALAYRTKSLRARVEPVLIEVLPKVSEEQANKLDREQREAILYLLHSENPSVVEGALHVIGDFGGREELDRLTDRLSALPAQTAKAAAEAVSSIQARVDLQRERETLLRASHKGEAQAETLLRSASGQDDSLPEQLLRPSEG